MHLIKSSSAPAFEIPGLSVIGLAAPSRGASETCVWRITMAPGTPATPHAISREEIFVALSGVARIQLDGRDQALAAGDTLVVPAGETFALSNPGADPFTALAMVPVGAEAVFPGGERFTPPWTV